MNYNQYAVETQEPSKFMVGTVACATTLVVAAVTFALTSNNASANLYTSTAVRASTRVAPVAQVPAQTQSMTAAQAQIGDVASPEVVFAAQPAGNKTLLVASASSMLLAVVAALTAAFRYRSEALAMASASGKRGASKGMSAQGGQAGVGYKGSTVAGSAPPTRDGKPGYVYKLGVKNGRGNVDEYSPVYNPAEWKSSGDTFEFGTTGIAIWAASFLALLGLSGFLIFTTSSL